MRVRAGVGAGRCKVTQCILQGGRIGVKPTLARLRAHETFIKFGTVYGQWRCLTTKRINRLTVFARVEY